ncbi:poly [ADP-ribose] polymerase, partial [Paragonimus westermani]
KMKRPLGSVQADVSSKSRRTTKPSNQTEPEKENIGILTGAFGRISSLVKQLLIKGKAPVDSFCIEKFGVAHVYYEDDTTVYDVMLNQVSHAAHSMTSIADKRATFSDKTGNEWDSRDEFVKIDGKYDLVKLDYLAADEQDRKVVKKEQQTTIESVLHPAVQALIRLICDRRCMEEAVTELKYDARRAPLGKLTKEQVKAGYTALNKIADCIAALTAQLDTSSASGKAEKKHSKPKRTPSNANEQRKWEHALLMACNEFYTRIPHDFGMRVPPLLRTIDEVKEKLELLQALDDIEFAVKVLETDTNSTKNVLDQRYKQLECDLKPLENTTSMFSILRDYLLTNHGPTHNWYTIELLDVFECYKPSEFSQFKDYGNRMLLWHGSRLSNWVGILGRGLKIAPPEAPVTGYMFGKGIYFADSSSKSANYAYPTQKNNIGLLALCEVRLISICEHVVFVR